MKILILDNYDSFTYNLYHLVEDVMPDGFGLSVRRNDEISIKDVEKYDKIIISPGPGLPKDAGITCDLIATYSRSKSILGVCLGHQAIAEVFGGKLINLKHVLHGKAINTMITVMNEPLFFGCSKVFETGRYHSWAVDKATLPGNLRITATDELGLIMALSHENLDVKGVQFHPESVMTGCGKRILKNWTHFNPDNKPV